MRILVVGSGAREHALAWACRESTLTDAVYCAPGNGGTHAVAETVEIAETDAPALVTFAERTDIDLVVVGPDAAVAAGVADACTGAGIAVFGPSAAAGRIESSKRFAKELMDRAGIATARWQAVSTVDQGIAAARGFGGACVVKADGLTRGKGVTVCDDETAAEAALRACLHERRFGDAGRLVLVEERLQGRELSVFAVADGSMVRVLGTACDYKRAHDGDTGPNTGGMGAYAPPLGIDGEALLAQTLETVLQPCVDALRAAGSPFTGCLYAGLMLTDAGPRVLEFNARFGDPETQVLVPLLAQDLVELMGAAAIGELPGGQASLHHGTAVGVVLAADGYPEAPRTGAVITGLDRVDRHAHVFHAGTARADDGAVSVTGGRVLTVVGRGHDLATARLHAYENAERISFDGGWMRGDIAAVEVTT